MSLYCGINTIKLLTNWTSGQITVYSAGGNLLLKTTIFAKEWLILSVPSIEDDNPEHIHLFTEEKINDLFKKYNLSPKFEYVLNHMIIKVKL